MEGAMAAKRKSYVSEARERWPRAIWIIGCGEYASVSHCDPGMTVMLFETLAEARIAKSQIDKTACGGGCRGLHSIVNLAGRRVPRGDDR
jgi:hypothetical protein